jgi:hypothetical protein
MTTTQPTTASPLDAHAAPTQSSGRRSGRAMAALIVGIIGIVAVLIPIVAVILGIVAIVLGATARSDIRRKGCLGEGQAKAAVICGIVAIVGAVIVFAIALASA